MKPDKSDQVGETEDLDHRTPPKPAATLVVGKTRVAIFSVRDIWGLDETTKKHRADVVFALGADLTLSSVERAFAQLRVLSTPDGQAPGLPETALGKLTIADMVPVLEAALAPPPPAVAGS